ncbi:OprO/OprP family phosphate-selective porin [Singulisphaera sp. PoT]|uniref:OprO/OprP family phosphate-selective porin n=1 Tax=Singulisphaera sp. PoT TaxID=3411797 RepID=UPI003BF4F245
MISAAMVVAPAEGWGQETMQFVNPGQRARWFLLGITAWASLAGMGAFAQTAPPAPAPDPASAASPPLPAPGVPAAGDPSGAASPPATREAQLEARIQQLESMVQQLSTQVQAMSAPGAAPAGSAPAGTDAGGDAPGSTATDPDAPRSAGSGDTATAAANATPSQSGGAAAPGQSFPPNPPPSLRFDSPATLDNRPGKVKFGPGFEIKTDDDEFFLQFHNLTQFDYRGYIPNNQNPIHDTFAFPRQWWMFSGRITKPVGYFLSFANGFDSLSLLDVFVDFNYDPRLQLRIGRFKTPFTYEFLVKPIQGLVMPERSVFFNNFGQNRDLGVMTYGRLFKHFDYAAGIFNGTRNGYVANGDDKFFSALVSWKPFGNAEGSILENFAFGGSVFTGNNNSINPVPQTLRTIVPTTGNSVAGVPFLNFNNNVRETGPVALWDLHAAYFYKQLAITGEWGSGFQDYALSTNVGNRTHLPINSFYVEGGYLLTGETRSSLGIVKPKRPFDLRKGKFGTGAWELTSRYQYLDLGNEVFTHGLADPNSWANRVSLADLGFNWHLTQYLKFMFMWEHADFNNPVQYAPGKRSLSNNSFIARLQLFF